MVNLVLLKKENKYLYEGLVKELLERVALKNEEQILKENEDNNLLLFTEQEEAFYTAFNIDKTNPLDIAEKMQNLMFREIPEKEEYLKDDVRVTLAELLIDSQKTSMVLEFSWDDEVLNTFYEKWYLIRKNGFNSY